MDYFHLLSGQDWPCKKNEEFDEFFEKNNGVSFMHYDSEIEAKEWIKGKYPNRYMRWYFNDFFSVAGCKIQPLRNFLGRFFNKFIPRTPIDNVHAGWNWFSWSRNVVEYVLTEFYDNSAFFRRFHFTTCCDEIVFHTLLANHLNELKINPHNSLKFVEWHPKRKYEGKLPLILRETEYNEIVDSQALFCRKVDYYESQKLIKMLE